MLVRNMEQSEQLDLFEMLEDNENTSIITVKTPSRDINLPCDPTLAHADEDVSFVDKNVINHLSYSICYNRFNVAKMNDYIIYNYEFFQNLLYACECLESLKNGFTTNEANKVIFFVKRGLKYFYEPTLLSYVSDQFKYSKKINCYFYENLFTKKIEEVNYSTLDEILSWFFDVLVEDIQNYMKGGDGLD